MGTKSAQRMFLVKVDGVTGWWAQKTGGAVTVATTKVWDGGSLVPDVLTAPADAEDLTLTRPYDRSRDFDVVRYLRRMVGRKTFTITVQSTDRDLTVTKGHKDTYSGLLTRVKSPDVDAGSADAGTLEITFAVSTVV